MRGVRSVCGKLWRSWGAGLGEGPRCLLLEHCGSEYNAPYCVSLHVPWGG